MMSTNKWLNDLNLGFKIQGLLLFLGIGATVLTTLAMTTQFESKLNDQANNRLQGIANIQSINTVNYLKGLQTEIKTLAATQGIVDSLSAYDEAFSDTQREGIFKAYAEDKSDSSIANSAYAQIHNQNFAEYERFITERGYYDLFLINTAGDVMFTVAKEADFVQNLNTNPQLNTSGLAEAFKGAMGQPNAMTDFASYAPSAGIPASFLAAPVKNDAGKTIGVLALQVSVTALSNSVNTDQGMGETGDVFLVGKDGTYRSISRFDKNENEVVLKKTVPTQYAEAKVNADSKETHVVKGTNRDMDMVAAIAPVKDDLGLNWRVVAEQSENEISKPMNEAQTTALLLFLAIGATCWFVSIGAAKMIKAPFLETAENLEKLKDGQTDIQINHADKNDEVGQTARSMIALKDQLAQRQAMMSNLSDLAKKLEGSVDQNMKHLSKELSQLDSMATTMIGETTTNLNGVTAVTDSTQQMSIAATEISHQVASTSNQASAATQQSDEAKDTVLRLFETAEDISGVINIIREITEQTKLLALNAHIEASRAGAAGRGFSVVANQVKDLARQTAKATDDITQQVQSLQKAVKHSSASFDLIANSITEVSGASQNIAAAVEEQTATLQDISLSLGSVSHDSQQLKIHADQINGSSKRVNHCVEDMGKNLSEFVNELKQLQ